MNQVIVSYILGRLAKVADVNPSDVKTSLFRGTIEIQRLSIREEVLKKLPLELQIEVIPLIYIKLPIPGSSDSVHVKVSGVHVKIPLHALQTPPKDGTRLWENLTPDMFFTEEDAAALQAAEERGTNNGCSSEEEDHVTPDDQSALGDSLSSLPSNIDESDLASCLSDAESSMSSSSFESEDHRGGGGAFSFFKDKMKRSVEWIVNRKIEVEIEDTTVEIVVDQRKGVSAVGSILRATACVDPAQELRKDSVRHINVSVVDIVLTAVLGQLKAPLLRVEKVEVNVSLVESIESGKMVRINTTVEVDAVQCALDDTSVGIVARCIEPAKNMMAIPPFCHPYLQMRCRNSWWPYTRNAVKAMLQDLKQRYNFNMSHIRFYANSRRRYLRLLDECYKDRLIGSRARDLEELENDLRYPDVIQFLRRTVQEKYGVTPTSHSNVEIKFSTQVSSPLKASPPTSTAGPSNEVAKYLHVDVKIVRVKLPLRSAVALHEVHVVQRLNELYIDVTDVGFHQDRTAYFAKASDAKSLLSVEHHMSSTNQETRVSLQPCAITLSLQHIVDILAPLMQVASQQAVLDAIQPTESPTPSGAESIQSKEPVTTTPPKSRNQSTVLFLLAPSLLLQVDVFLLTVCNASVVIQNSGGMIYPQYGLNMDELSIRCKKEYILNPIHVEMLKDNSILCSHARIEVSNTVWSSLKSSGKVVASCIPEELMKLSKRPKKISSQPIVVHRLGGTIPVGELLDVELANWKKPRQAQTITLESLSVKFELLDLTTEIQLIQVAPAVGRGVCGWSVDVKQLEVALGEEDRHQIHVYSNPQDTQEGSGSEHCVQALFLPSGRIGIHLHRVVVAQKCPTFDTPFKLASISHLEVGLHNSNTALRVSDMTALEGLEVKDVLVGMRGEPLAYQDRPYVASTIQVAGRIVDIDLKKMGNFMPDPLISLGVHLDSILASEMVSQPAYNTFYSGFSHMMFSIGLDDCPVTISPTARLLLSLTHSPSTYSDDVEERAVEPVLPIALLPSASIVMFADVENLATYLTVGHLQLRLSAPRDVTTAAVQLDIRGAKCQIPIPKFEVWNRRVLAKPPLQLRACVNELELGIPVQLFTDCGDNVFSIVTLGTQRILVEKVPEPTSVAPSKISRASSEAPESVSTASAEDSLTVNHLKVSTNGVLLVANAAHPIEVYRQLFTLAEHLALIPQIFGHATIISSSTSKQLFVLEETGDIFFDTERSTEVLLVDSCSFRSAVTDRCLVVADGTVVLFRDCIFEHQEDDFIRTTGSSAFFFCENCTDTIIPKKAKRKGAEGVTKVKTGLSHCDVVVHLANKTILRARNQAVEASVTIKPSLKFSRFRINGECVDISDDGLETVVCSKVSVESELSYKPKKKALEVNLSLSLGEVTVPIISHFLPQFLAIKEIPLNSPPPRRYCVPRRKEVKDAPFPLDQWKVLVSFSVLPIHIALRNGCVIAKLSISNGYIWTSYDPLQRAVATLEGHLGISHMSMLNFTVRSFVPVTSGPIDISMVGEAPDQHSVTVDLKMSLGEIKWTTDQLRLVTTLAQHITDVGTTAVRVVNRTGERRELQYEGNKRMIIEEGEQAKVGPCIALHQNMKSITKVGEATVEHIEKASSSSALYGMERAVSFATYHLVLSDARHYFMVKAVTRNFVQEIQLYTEFQIKNETQYTLSFMSAPSEGQSEKHFYVPAHSFSCVPSYLLDAKDLKLSLQWEGIESSAEPVWSQDCAYEFMELALAQDEPPQTVRLGFRFIASGSVKKKKAYVDVVFEVARSRTLYMFVIPSQPELRSNIVYPMEVDVLDQGGQVQSTCGLSPGGYVHLYNTNPLFPHAFRLRVLVEKAVFESTETFSLTSELEELSIVVRKKDEPKRRFFELYATPFYQAGSHVCGWTIQSTQFLDSSGLDPGSKDGKSFPGGYVPLKSPMQLQFEGTSLSDPFELSSSGEGNVVECAVEGIGDADVVTCTALLRPLRSTFFFAMEVMPPLLIKNDSKKGLLRLRHQVYGNASNRPLFSQTIVVPAGSQSVPYFTLASSGYTNNFSFAWENEEFSHSMESSLSPGTSWTGVLECGASTHRVIISKAGPYDPAVISIGPPQQLHFQFVNLTYSEFLEAPYMSVRRCASPLFLSKPIPTQSTVSTGAWDQEEMVVSRCNGARYRIRVAENNIQEVEPDVFLYTVVGNDGMTTVVACGWNLNNGAISNGSMQSRLNCTISLNIPSVTLSLMHEKTISLQLTIQAINIWATISNTYSVQSTLAGVALSTGLKDKLLYVVEPFEINTSLRDTKLSSSAVSVRSFQSTVTPIVIIISDYFLGQLYQILTMCANAPHCSFSGNWEAHTLVQYVDDTVVQCPKRVYLESATLSSIGLEVSWDRSVGAPKDTLQGFLPWWTTLIPSLHHATLTTPQIEFRQLSRDSFGALAASVQSLYLKELLKQIPKFVGTVGLFKKNTSILKHFATKIGGLFFGHSDNHSVSGASSTLI
eukprot:gene10170-7124_t